MSRPAPLTLHAPASPWPQPIAPVHSLAASALLAAVPLALVLLLMGGLRRSGLVSSAWGLSAAAILAVGVWRMPPGLAACSVVLGFVYAAWSILWLVFCALWLYQLSLTTGSFESLRRWMREHASGDPCVQAMLVAFCFGALLEGSAGFGAPVAVTAYLLVGLGFDARKAVVVSLLANTAPVAFGSVGVPIIALSGVTGLDVKKLSGMVGRQLPVLSFILPAYIAWVVEGRRGVRRSWTAALVTGGSYALTQFLVSNLWGPYATDILSSAASIVALVAYLRLASPTGPPTETISATSAWLPWVCLSAVMVLWSYFDLFQWGQVKARVPHLNDAILVTLYERPYEAIYTFQPLAGGTAVLVATLATALLLRVKPRPFLESGARALRQLRVPGLTVLFIVGLAYLYNYSGLAYTLGAAAARLGVFFPIASSFLGWVACFLSGSDTAANLLFGNLQVAAAHQLHLSPVLLAATNSSGAVTGKMISPQNIAVGVTTVGLVGREGTVLHGTFWHSVAFAALLGLVAFLQAYYLTRMTL